MFVCVVSLSHPSSRDLLQLLWDVLYLRFCTPTVIRVILTGRMQVGWGGGGGGWGSKGCVKLKNLLRIKQAGVSDILRIIFLGQNLCILVKQNVVPICPCDRDSCAKRV